MEKQAFYLRTGAALGALAVILGAFGAHALARTLSNEMAEVYDTAVRYHFYHALAILAVAAGAGSLWSSRWCVWACRLWALGIVIFSGSLYLLAATEIAWLGAITPIGGAAMIAGWASIALAAAPHRRQDP